MMTSGTAINQQPRPYRLSVVMIVKNEAKNLEKSLPALHGWIDELIVLDSGSTDHGQTLVQQAGGQWYRNTNWPGFGKQRQIAQQYATGDWILALDADEEITPHLRDSILEVIKNPPEQVVYGIKRIDCIFGHKIDNPYWPVKAHWRLYPKNYQYNDNLVHESVDLNHATCKKLDGFLLHHTADTPLFWLDKRLSYAKAWAEDRFPKGKRVSVSSIFLRSFWAFFKQYIVDGRFLMGKYGLFYAALFAQYTFNKYAILYDLAENKAEQTFKKSLLETEKQTVLVPENKRSTVSLVMIVKNEARHLAACLDTVKDLVDEIVLLDSGSTDLTREIAIRYGAKWYINTHWQGFGKQRQIAQSYATSDYILVLDADERLDHTLRASILNILQQPVKTDVVYAFNRRDYFCGRVVRQGYFDAYDRLYARQSFDFSDAEVHESLDRKAIRREILQGVLYHHTNDSLFHFLYKNIQYSHQWAQQNALKKKSIWLISAFLRAFVSFIREYVLRSAWRTKGYGLIFAIATMGYTLDKYLMLWHEQNDRDISE
ncbi:glycosyltransferase family 2 protein [Acinetobacter pollinis]|uniref:glycosyltransferase family 2 protein n=1 Tax=Acinetobacter pollinis TaxID=2605270 RepID=UPI001D18BDD6|nr:glycosyltransferase family 2 protein [Acinetobacter pollinis]